MRNSYLPKKATKKEQAITQPEVRRELYRNISEILQAARQNAYRAINFVMVEAYWNIGKLIVEEDQQGEARAEYGKQLIKELSKQLSAEFGRGFTVANIWNFRQFYLIFQTDEKLYALRRELTWTHYRLIMRLDNPSARDYYMQEAAEQNWSTRALERQINSLYYERLLTSRNKAPVIEEMQEKTTILAQTPQDFIKDPYVLELIRQWYLFCTKEKAIAKQAVSQFETKIGQQAIAQLVQIPWGQNIPTNLPDEFRSSLPSIGEIGAELSGGK